MVDVSERLPDGGRGCYSEKNRLNYRAMKLPKNAQNIKINSGPRVDTHRSTLMQKLGLRHTAALVKHAIDKGLDR